MKGYIIGASSVNLDFQEKSKQKKEAKRKSKQARKEELKHEENEDHSEYPLKINVLAFLAEERKNAIADLIKQKYQDDNVELKVMEAMISKFGLLTQLYNPDDSLIAREQVSKLLWINSCLAFTALDIQAILFDKEGKAPISDKEIS